MSNNCFAPEQTVRPDSNAKKSSNPGNNSGEDLIGPKRIVGRPPAANHTEHSNPQPCLTSEAQPALRDGSPSLSTCFGAPPP